jgi:glycosyltransferase involved in cell wall biosynthesis
MTLLHRAELRCIQRADHTIVISDAELAVVHRELPDAKVSLVPLVREFEAAPTTNFEERAGMAFVGNYQHPPNIDAVLFFLKEVWPLIHREIPDARFFVVGSYMPDTIREASSEGVELLGFVDALDDLFSRIRLSVAPLRVGAGLKGKVATSLGYGVPIVMTTIAAEGMGLQNGEDALIADDPMAFAESVIRLYSEPFLWHRLSIRGSEAARRLFSIEVSEAAYSSIFRQLGLPVIGGQKLPESS